MSSNKRPDRPRLLSAFERFSPMSLRKLLRPTSPKSRSVSLNILSMASMIALCCGVSGVRPSILEILASSAAVFIVMAKGSESAIDRRFETGMPAIVVLPCLFSSPQFLLTTSISAPKRA